jgi:hypothetical protein
MKMDKKEGKLFIWKGLRVSFWVMIGVWVISLVYGFVSPNGLSTLSTSAALVLSLISLLWFLDTIFTFVVSIIHLTKYKEKAFAVTSLVFSSLLMLLTLLQIFATLSKVA